MISVFVAQYVCAGYLREDVAHQAVNHGLAIEEGKAAVVYCAKEVLDRVVGPAKKAGASGVGKAVNPLEARIAELRAALLDSPEVRGLVETGDPTKPAALQLGADGQLWESDGTAGVFQEMTVFSPAPPIYAGSDQIQRNLLGERALGLPKEPGPSPETPFRDLPKN